MLDDRIQFIAMYLKKELSFTQLCQEFGVSRKTGYKYVERYKRCGPEGLHDLSRAPHNHPNAVCSTPTTDISIQSPAPNLGAS